MTNEVLYTCKGKGGLYHKIGTAVPAGSLKGHVEAVVVYADVVTGSMYFRTTEDFDVRMEKLGEQHEFQLQEDATAS